MLHDLFKFVLCVCVCVCGLLVHALPLKPPTDNTDNSHVGFDWANEWATEDD
jgi:hypothetical protein